MYLTEQDAWRALVQHSNELGHRGRRVTNAGVVHPNTATGTYNYFVETDAGPQTASESW